MKRLTGHSFGVTWQGSSMDGWATKQMVRVFAVFDGHGGPNNSNMLSQEFGGALQKHLDLGLEMEPALTATYATLEQKSIDEFDNLGETAGAVCVSVTIQVGCVCECHHSGRLCV